MTIIDDSLSEHDFEVCFATEPATSTDPAADLARGRARRRRTLGLAAGAAVAAAAVLVTLTAVSAQPTDRLEAIPAGPPSPTAVPPERTFLLSPDADQRIYYSTIQSDPLPTPPPKTTVDSAAAVTTARGGPGGTPIAVLRLISAPGHLSGIPTEPEPYWVLVWPNTPPVMRGGPMIPDQNRREAADKKRAEDAANLVCGDVTFVNANTGRQVNGIWQNCTRR